MTDIADEPESIQNSSTEEEEQSYAKKLIGLTVTDATFSLEAGYMIEFDHRVRFRTCCEHAAFFRRVIQ